MLESKKSVDASKDSNLSLLHRVWSHLSPRRHRQFWLTLGLMLLSAVTEVASLGAIMPFLAAIASPEAWYRQPVVQHWAMRFGLTSAADTLYPLTVIFALAALAAGLSRMSLLWASTRLANASGSDLSIEVYSRTLYQPYRVHIARNSSDVISGLAFKVNGAANALYQVMVLVSSGILLVFLTVTLLLIDAKVAIFAATGFGVCYLLTTWAFRKQLERNAERIAKESTQTIKALQEGLGAIREVLLDGTQQQYIQIYRNADHPLRLALGNNVFIGGSPRFAMEALGMVLIASLAYQLSRGASGLSTALPVLGALAMAAQRLMPAMQQAYAAWIGITGSRASLLQTIELLEQPMPEEARDTSREVMQFDKEIRFNAVSFQYLPDGVHVLDNVNLVIAKGARVGIVGSTGSGKSTLTDVLMALAAPSSGCVMVDGVAVEGGQIRAWQRRIAHVPQNIFLADSSFAENIAFGIAPDKIDFDRVRQAAQQAHVAEFIESRPGGYDALVGERGVSLSGGQRQRIGIARALYKQADVLVLDEATSALDNATERDVMEAIDGLAKGLTVVMIAHRLSTVQRCDCIIELRKGRVVAAGSYTELLAMSESFREMNKAGENA